MHAPRVTLVLPSGEAISVEGDSILGRSAAAQVRIDDARISTVHAEFSLRSDGFSLIARGGRLVVCGRGVREVVLTPGLVIDLAPGVSVRVTEVIQGLAPIIPPTVGRDRLRFVVSTVAVRVHVADTAEPTLVLTGVGARVVAILLDRPQGTPWDEVAELAWPDEGEVRRATRDGTISRLNRWTEVDERRLRNRWDQQLSVLRRQVADVREGLIQVQRGLVAIPVGPDDVIARS